LILFLIEKVITGFSLSSQTLTASLIPLTHYTHYLIYIDINPSCIKCELLVQSSINQRQVLRLTFCDISSSWIGKKSILNHAKNIVERWQFEWVNLITLSFKNNGWNFSTFWIVDIQLICWQCRLSREGWVSSICSNKSESTYFKLFQLFIGTDLF